MGEPSPGVYVLDFGQNIAGWVRIRVRGSANTTVQLRHAELLMHPPYVYCGRSRCPAPCRPRLVHMVR